MTAQRGVKRVYRTVPVASELPERSVRTIPALAPSGDLRWPDDLPRPSSILTPPEPVRVVALLPDHPPALFIWRGLRRRVVHADGPERVLGEWWRCDAELSSVRDYFRVEDEAGERFWLFRDAAGRGRRALVAAWVRRDMSYAELQVTSHFSFLRGASSPAELFIRAARAWDARPRHRRPQFPGRHRAGA